MKKEDMQDMLNNAKNFIDGKSDIFITGIDIGSGYTVVFILTNIKDTNGKYIVLTIMVHPEHVNDMMNYINNHHDDIVKCIKEYPCYDSDSINIYDREYDKQRDSFSGEIKKIVHDIYKDLDSEYSDIVIFTHFYNLDDVRVEFEDSIKRFAINFLKSNNNTGKVIIKFGVNITETYFICRYKFSDTYICIRSVLKDDEDDNLDDNLHDIIDNGDHLLIKDVKYRQVSDIDITKNSDNSTSFKEHIVRTLYSVIADNITTKVRLFELA